MKERRGLASAAVLLSTYNGEGFLGAQLDSVAAQEGIQVQVFARDDGSTDATLAILAGYAGRWPQLANPLNGANLGPADSFLELLAAAPRGFDHYAFCDQDDVWAPDKLKRAAAWLDGVPDGRPALYCSRVTYADAALHPTGVSLLNDDPRFEHVLFENIAFGNTVVMNAAAQDLFRNRPPTGVAIMHDWWCCLVVAALGVVIFDPESRVLYRQHQANTIGAAPSRWRAALLLWGQLRRAPRRFYPIQAQTDAFLTLFGARLEASKRHLAQMVADSRRPLAGRIGLALSRRVRRTRWVDAIAGRILILAGWY